MEYRKIALKSSAAAAALLASTAIFAQAKTIDVPSEDAGRSIPELARQAGIQIVLTQVGAYPAVAPPAQLHHDGPQLLTRLGQDIAPAGALAPDVDHPGARELAQAQRQQGGGHQRHAFVDLAKARAAGHELANDEQGPALAQQLGCLRQRAKLTV